MCFIKQKSYLRIANIFQIIVLMVYLSQLRLKQKIFGEHTGVSPETYLSTAWNVFAVTPFFLLIFNSFLYANTEWSMSLYNKRGE